MVNYNDKIVPTCVPIPCYRISSTCWTFPSTCSTNKEKSVIFIQKIVYVDVGDTVTWKSKEGHNVEFIRKNGVPKGVKKFKSRISKDASYKFTVPGIYAYWCSPHKTLGMIGFVVVGNDKSNLSEIKKVKFAGKSKKVAKQLIKELEK